MSDQPIKSLDPERCLQWVEHGDGTADVSRDGGKTWTRERFPIEIWKGDSRLVMSGEEPKAAK